MRGNVSKTQLSKISKDLWVFGCVIIFFILNILLLLYHETWIDEIQAWELQKNNSIVEIYNHCKAEGHPMLWYLILKPFTMLGFPIKTMNVISIIFMTLAVYLFLKYVDTNSQLKILIVFGGSMFYYNAVNARTYSLVCLALVLIDITYKNRKEHPYKYNLQLLLLTQTHILTCGFIAGFWLVEVYEMIKDFGVKGSFIKKEARNRLYGLLIYSFGIVWLLAQLAGIGASKAYTNGVVFFFDELGTQEIIQRIIVSLVLGLPNLLYNAMESTIYQLVMLRGLPDQMTIALQNLAQSYVVFLIAILIQIFLAVHLWNVNKQKLFTIYLGVVAANLISYFITGMNVSRLLIIISCIVILQSSENDKIKKSVDTLNKFSFIGLQVILLIYSQAMAVRETYCTFGLDVGQVQNVVEHIESDDTTVLLDEHLEGGANELIQFITGKPFYYTYIGEYKTYMSLVGYSKDDYLPDETTGRQIPKPIEDLIKFAVDSNIDPDNLVIPVFLQADVENDEFLQDDQLTLKAAQEYLRVYYKENLPADQFVMQLDGTNIYLLKPNDKFIELYNQYKQLM